MALDDRLRRLEAALGSDEPGRFSFCTPAGHTCQDPDAEHFKFTLKIDRRQDWLEGPDDDPA